VINNVSKYSMQKACLDNKWDDFIKSSDNGTAFIYSEYLNSLEVNIQPYFCYKKQELMGAVLCILSENGENVIGHKYVVYDGLIYRNLDYLNNSQKISEEFKIQQYVSDFLMKEYTSINLKLHPSINDIRSFSWCNYNDKGPKYFIDIRYTSYVSITDFLRANKLEDIEAYNNSSVARRQEIRYALKKQVKTKETRDVERFILFYQKTMLRQGALVDSDVENIRKMLNILMRGEMCLMMESSNNQNKIGSMAVFLLDNKRAYYLFGASDPDMRSQHTGTSILWDSFHLLSKYGYQEIDLEGVNSPYRGWFKLSFGGSCVPYFHLKK
jgi:hypothetical protein